MLGIGRGVTLSLAGWLWADILLGLFAIFLAANSVGAATPAAVPGIDPQPVTLSLTIDGPKLLGFDAAAGAEEQRRIAATVKAQVAQQTGGRKVAIVIAFASNADPSVGDDISRVATGQLTGDAFAGATIKTYHSIVAGDRGTSLDLEIYVYR
ncbi:MAG TPA: hypothetical protein DCK98_13150 [Chloroflexi bacterium]|jgi:hypothetical protein|nr:hypothetical protein [Chloroflexota bacterium]HAL26156.1 hypothetical protein [Chloroflexota bacterium]